MASDAATRIVCVSGLSGSGKSTAMAALEDQGFYCVDNMPAQLVEEFLNLCTNAVPPIEKVALAIDAREPLFLKEVPRLVEGLRKGRVQTQVIFLESSNEVVLNRYRETRRIHPLAPDGAVEEGIETERRLLVEIAGLADKIIDTSALNAHQLKAAIVQYISGESRPTVVNIVSFGFRYGPPSVAELLFDVRFLPNPYFDKRLRDRTGHNAEVADYVMGSAAGAGVLERVREFCSFLLPLYDGEGKAYLTIGVGCTGGQHRSVAFVEALGAALRADGREVNIEHRDVERSR